MGGAMKKIVLGGLVALAAAALGATPAHASHSWGNYHWAKAATSNPSVSVTLGENLVATSSSNWPVLFKGTSGATLGDPGSVVHDWSHLNLMPLGTGNGFADILDTPRTTGINSNRKRCKPASGRVEVCNARYGFNGWLGLATIWISGGHITQGVAKVNDSYLDSSRYATAARQHVLCQEVGHTFGLDHQDESGADLDTCMDYADAFDNAHPDDHDNQQINLIYSSHTDGGGGGAAFTGRGQVRRLHDDVYVEEFPGGGKAFTFITWESGEAAAQAPNDRVPE
jgi:hypothetical protein